MYFVKSFVNNNKGKHVEHISPAGVIVGCDFSGIVEKVGENVSHVKVLQ